MLRTLVTRQAAASPGRPGRPASYPRFTGKLRASSPAIAPRQLLPLRPHPAQTAQTSASQAPQQPPRPALSTPPGWEARQHAAPAAYPRSMPQALGTLSRGSHPFSASTNGTTTGNGSTQVETKEERNKRLIAEKDACVSTRHGARVWPLAEALAAAHPPLWIAAERWLCAAPAPDGLTLVLTHACGLNKEHWRPVVRHLLGLLESPSGAEFGTGAPLPGSSAASTGSRGSRGSPPRINEVWFLEDSNHGASVDLNAGALGPALCWDDSAREVINFVENVLPSVSPDSPFALPFAPSVRKHRVIGIGHSYGGNALAQAAEARPELFEALCLVEPMTVPVLVNDTAKGSPLTMGALKRRSEWPSLEAARAVRSNALFGPWDEEQFDLWLSHHLVPAPGGGVTLATPRWAEAQTFSEPDAPMRGWDKLAGLEMPVGFVMAGDETWMTGEATAQELVWRPTRARNERIMDASHLVIQERPREAAEAIDRFLRTLPAWDAATPQ